MTQEAWRIKYLRERCRSELISQTWQQQYVELQEQYKELLKEYYAEHSALTQSNITIQHMAEIFSNTLELTNGLHIGYTREVADHAKMLAISLGLDAASVDNLYIASLLHDIGRYGLPENLVKLSSGDKLTVQQQNELKKIPWLGMTFLLSVPQLEESASIILHYRESLDGSGYPKGLKADKIPFLSQILAVVVDYYEITHEISMRFNKVTSRDALLFIKDHSGVYYNSSVVSKLEGIIKLEASKIMRNEIKVDSKSLAEDMVLSRSLVNARGVLILPKHHKITKSNIESILTVEQDEPKVFEIFVKAGHVVENVLELKHCKQLKNIDEIMKHIKA